MPDIQQERAEIELLAGVANLRLLFSTRRWTLPVRLNILTSTGFHRGVHMSRLVAAAQKHQGADYLEDALRAICRDVDGTQRGARIRCELDYPYKDQFMPIVLELGAEGEIAYTFQRTGITACPCSKAIAGVAHMQRSILLLQIRSDEILNFEEVGHLLDTCFSAEPEPFLRRAAEAAKVREAQDNPRFVEDVVRECLRRFPAADMIEARSAESIHTHDAIARWVLPGLVAS